MMKKWMRCTAWLLAVLMTAYALPASAVTELSEGLRAESVIESGTTEPGVLCEDVSARTANTKTYIRSDGLRRIDVYAFDLHRQTSEGWVERAEFADGRLARAAAGRSLADAALSVNLESAGTAQTAAATSALTIRGLPLLPDDMIILSANLRLQEHTVSAPAQGSDVSGETSGAAASDAPQTLQSAPAVLDVTDAVVGMYAGGGNQLVLALPSAACAIPPDGVVLTVLAMSNSQLERSGSWEAYDSFTNAAVYVNTFNGALQLEVNCLTSAGNLLPTTNSLLYFSYASGSSYPFTANGWILNVHETVSLDTSGTLLYYDDCYNQRRIYQSEAPPADPYDVVRYTSQTGPDYIEYTATSKQAVFNDGYGNKRTLKNGYLRSVSDGSGNTIEYTYSDIRPTGIRLYNTASGLNVNLFSFSYDGGNLKKIVNLETNESVQFEYSTNGLVLNNIIFYKGTVETDRITLGYSGTRLTSVTDRASSAFSNALTVEYDSNGRVTALSRPNGARTTFSYGNSTPASNRLTKISSSYNSYEDTYHVFTVSGRTKSVYTAKRSAAPPVALSASAVIYDGDGKVLHQGATSFPDNDYNALANYTFNSQSGWGLVNAAYAVYSGSQAMKITGDAGKLNFAYQGVSPSNFKGISKDGHFMVSGWVRSANSSKNIDTEAYVNQGGTSFGLSCVVKYSDGTQQDVRVNADPYNTGWQYVSLLVRPDAGKSISSIAVYCSYDYNSGTAYFENLSLKAVAGESYAYNDKSAVTNVNTKFGSTVNTYASDGYRLTGQSVRGRGQSITYTGNLVTQTTRLNCNNGSLKTNYTYDAYGNLKETKLSSPSVSRAITGKTNYLTGRFTTASYDSRDLAEYYSYGSDKSLAYVRSRSGLRTRYLYDNYGRISQVYADENENGTNDTENEHGLRYTYTNGTDKIATVEANHTNAADWLEYIFLYDSRGRLSKVGYYAMTETIAQYGYDSRNNLTSTTLANGYQQKQFYATDTGRLTAKGDADSYPFYYYYNQDGSLDYTTDSDNDRRVDYTYDVYGRVIKTEQKKRSTGALELRVSYAYDSYGRVSSVTEFDGSSTNTYTYTYYGTTETVKTVKRNSNIVTTYTYDALERLTGKTTTCTRSNGTTYTVSSESYAYRNGQTSAQTTPFVSTVTIGGGRVFEYTYDNAGNITTVKENGVQKVSYAYDKLGQLTRENNAYLGKTYTYTYDMIGNRTAKKTYAYTTAAALGTAQSTWSYTNIRDQLTKVNNSAITYDAAGNPKTWEGDDVSIEWEGKKLECVYLNSNAPYTQVSFGYDADGVRTYKFFTEHRSNASYKDCFTLDQGRIVSEMRIGQDEWIPMRQIYYYYDASGVALGFRYKNHMTGSESEYFYGRNGQGEIIQIISSTGAVVVEYAYDAWGVCTILYDTTSEKIGTINPFRYKDYYYDIETGWYYLNSRYYDPEAGRFLSADPVLGSNGDLLSYNRYLYCSNNPVMYTDPSGEGILVALVAGALAVYVYKVVTDERFYEDIRNYDPNNTDPNKTLNSHYFSSYKGKLVLRHSIPGFTSWAIFGTIFLNRKNIDNENGRNTLNHEWGHTQQEEQMGTLSYIVNIALPSVANMIKGTGDYYSQPWERSADYLGGVDRGNYASGSLEKALTYLKDSRRYGVFYPLVRMFD